MQLNALMSKVALLCLHFPRLRLIWSRSLHATADIFQQLKANQEEPDPIAGKLSRRGTRRSRRGSRSRRGGAACGLLPNIGRGGRRGMRATPAMPGGGQCTAFCSAAMRTRLARRLPGRALCSAALALQRPLWECPMRRSGRRAALPQRLW